MENVIPIEELPAHIDRVINQVNEGVVLARKRGILAEFPDDGGVIQFDVVVVFKWQSPDLVIVGTDTSKGSDTGTNTQKSTSKRVSEDSSSSEDRSNDRSSSSGQNASYTYTD
jgi:hypothetical protein